MLTIYCRCFLTILNVHCVHIKVQSDVNSSIQESIGGRKTFQSEATRLPEAPSVMTQASIIVKISLTPKQEIKLMKGALVKSE
jgi:hypothetical protein